MKEEKEKILADPLFEGTMFSGHNMKKWDCYVNGGEYDLLNNSLEMSEQFEERVKFLFKLPFTGLLFF